MKRQWSEVVTEETAVPEPIPHSEFKDVFGLARLPAVPNIPMHKTLVDLHTYVWLACKRTSEASADLLPSLWAPGLMLVS